MANASDNAKELKEVLNKEYNQKRQAKITSEIIELVAGAGRFHYRVVLVKEQEEREEKEIKQLRRK